MESREFSDIVASDRSLLRIVTGQDFLNNFLHVSVVVIVEFHCVLLPEFLGMDWSPFQESPVDLVLPLLERTELLVVFIEVSPQPLQQSADFLVYPVSVLELNYQVKCVDVRHLLEAIGISFETIQKHQHDPHDLFLVEEVQDFGDILNHLVLVVP